jgi:hypothetical protein
LETPDTDKSSSSKTIVQLARTRILGIIRQLRKKYLVFLFFVALSSLAWFFRALSDTYVADLKYPVKYTNLPPNRILSKAPPDKLILRVSSDGYTILSNMLKYKRPLRYNVNAFSLYSLSLDSTSVYTLTHNAKDLLSAELNEKSKNIQILDINPDTLFFNFSRVKKKLVPIAIRIKPTENLFQRQYMFNGNPYAIPDTIEVTGPSSLIDTLSKVYTRIIVLNNLSDTVIKNINLEKIKRLEFREKKVQVVIPVDEFTESELAVSIHYKNVPDTLILKTFPSSIKVKYLVTLSNYDKVKNELFSAYVDFSTIDMETDSKMKIELDSLPPFIYNVKLSQRNVEFLIEKKSAESRNNGRNW